MKNVIIAIPILALLLLAAHALRQGDFGLTAGFSLVAVLVFSRRAWIRLASLVVLLWGGVIWADATVYFIQFRQAMQLPWERLSWIMGGVLGFNALALWALWGKTCREYFYKDKATALPRAAMFILTAFGLAMARAKVSFPVLLADRYLPGWGWLEIALLAFYAQWVGGLMLDDRRHRTLRPCIWGLFSVVFFGQLLLGLAGMDRMLMTGALHLPVPALILVGPIFRGDGFFMIILFSVTVLLVGPAWCSHLCYIGAWDGAMSRLGGCPVPNERLARLSVYGRLATLVLTVGIALCLRVMGVSGLTAIGLAALFGLAGVGVMAFVSRRAGVMAHCTAYCPMGLMANLFGKLSPWRIRIADGCTRCGACLSRCRYNALDDFSLERGRPAISCTLCGDCVSACVHGHLGYRFPGLSSEQARTVFIVLIVSLHALFMGVARI